MKNSEMVREFMLKFKQQVDLNIDSVDIETVGKLFGLRERLIREEFEELQVGLDGFMLDTDRTDPVERDQSKIEILDALADLLYVVYGAAIAFGMDIDEAMYRVHISNMTKLGRDGEPIYDASGKVAKGPDYQKPRLEDLV